MKDWVEYYIIICFLLGTIAFIYGFIKAKNKPYKLIIRIVLSFAYLSIVSVAFVFAKGILLF